MYTEKERNIFFKNIIDNVQESDNLLGTYLIGSSSIGFNDIYSDLDFMMAYNENADVKSVRDEILGFFSKNDIGYIMERKWSDTIWGISVYMKNGFSTDISFGPIDELKIKSPQITVGVDTDNKLEHHLQKGKEIFKVKYSNYNINDNITWEFMYLIRKYLIAVKRKNYLYAYYMLSDARMIIMKLEVLNEGKKLHEFKSFNELETEFLKEIENTIPRSLDVKELDMCKNKILDIFYKVIKENTIIKFDDNLKYLLELAD